MGAEAVRHCLVMLGLVARAKWRLCLVAKPGLLTICYVTIQSMATGEWGLSVGEEHTVPLELWTEAV